jgi:Fe-S cluster assembly iron-binding protein IscA
MIQIEAETLQQLLTVQRQLTGPCAGLRIQLSGDSRQGGQVSLEWSREQRTEDYAVNYQGLVLLAAIAHWPYLQSATLRAGEQDEQRGIWVELQATACHCDNQVCASPQTMRCE